MNWQLLAAKIINKLFEYVFIVLAYTDEHLENYKSTFLPVVVDGIDTKFIELILYPKYAKVHYYFKHECDLSYKKFVTKMGNMRTIEAIDGIYEIINNDGYVAINLISDNKNTK